MLNNHQELNVRREAVYGQVWAQPMIKVAKEYGVSDVALAKICKKLNVPYPGRGYWARKQTGKAVKQVPLPMDSDPRKQTATIHRTPRVHAITPMSDDTIRRINDEKSPEKKIEVPARLRSPHRLLRGQFTEWQPPKVNDYGAVWSGNIRQLNVRVSPKSISRALRILNTLLVALEDRGFAVEVKDGSLGVCINGGFIEFGLEERFRRVDHPDQKNPRLQSWERERYLFVPSGALCLKIIDWWADGFRKTWRDRKTAKLETCLNDFIAGLLKVSEAVNARRLKQQQEHQLRLDAERQREEEARKRQEELAKGPGFEQQAANWAKAQQLRAYLATLKDMLLTKYGEIRGGSPIDQWFIWAHQYIDRLDPLTGGCQPSTPSCSG